MVITTASKSQNWGYPSSLSPRNNDTPQALKKIISSTGYISTLTISSGKKNHQNSAWLNLSENSAVSVRVTYMYICKYVNTSYIYSICTYMYASIDTSHVNTHCYVYPKDALGSFPSLLFCFKWNPLEDSIHLP